VHPVIHLNAKTVKLFYLNNVTDPSRQEIHLLQAIQLNVEIVIRISNELLDY
jgi:hypothetical protein